MIGLKGGELNMKSVKLVLVIFSIILLSSTETLPDDAEFRVIETRNDQIIGGEFHVDLQIRIASGINLRTLSSITADLYYDAARLTQWSSNPIVYYGPSPSVYTVTPSKLSGFYQLTIAGGSVNSIGQNITAPGNPIGWDVTNIYKTVVTFRWTIASLGPLSLTISDATDAAAYFNDYDNCPYNVGGATQWTVSNNDLTTATPVELSTFNAKSNGNKVELYWETKTEVNNYGFEILRFAQTDTYYEGSTNEVPWKKIGFVSGSGNSNSPKEYSFIDKNPNGGSRFIYRLKQIDNDGKFEYSDEVEVEIVPNVFALYQNYPNPFNPTTTISFALPKDTDVRIILYNTLGEKLRIISSGRYQAGFHSVILAMDDFPGGVYIYRLESSDFVNTKKLMFLK